MKTSLIAIAAVIMIGAVSVFALSPYFTESSVDEALPAGAIIQPKMEDKETSQMMMDEEIQIMSYAGTFVGVGDGIHDAQGDAYTIPLEDGTNVLRLENFKSTNGPDLYVYLSTDSMHQNLSVWES